MEKEKNIQEYKLDTILDAYFIATNVFDYHRNNQ